MRPVYLWHGVRNKHNLSRVTGPPGSKSTWEEAVQPQNEGWRVCSRSGGVEGREGGVRQKSKANLEQQNEDVGGKGWVAEGRVT